VSERKLTTDDQGYFCVSEDNVRLVQGEAPDGDGGVTIFVGCDQLVVVDKMFGPLVFMPIRVRADFDLGEWIIEREFGPDAEWREVARIPGQLDSDFSDFFSA
jgi:hypothetical protein